MSGRPSPLKSPAVTVVALASELGRATLTLNVGTPGPKENPLARKMKPVFFTITESEIPSPSKSATASQLYVPPGLELLLSQMTVEALGVGNPEVEER